MKYLLIILLALALGCQKDLVKLTLENTCADESLVELTLNDEITMSATSLKHDVELLTPGTYIADIYLHKRDWWYTINLVDTITIEQETHCVAFFRDPITGQDDLIIWLTE